MYTYNCHACRKDFQSYVSHIKIQHWICPACIHIYVKVDRYFKETRKKLKDTVGVYPIKVQRTMP